MKHRAAKKCDRTAKIWRSPQPLRRFVILGLLISICLLVTLLRVPIAAAQESKLEALATLSASQSHPLPFTLAQWQDPQNSGDYFSQVKLTEVGYLVWSQFPIKVYIETAKELNQVWLEPVLKAVQEWNNYLPLQVVESKAADIRILPKVPPLQTANFLRARSAQTRYDLYINNSSKSSAILSHYCTIFLNPHQTSQYIQAAARHELGHALGIWGHSPVASDALYFSQVSDLVTISGRDINTLKRVYQQPTRLGWQVAVNSRF